jgi:mono/diheme cytochrome c family protein
MKPSRIALVFAATIFGVVAATAGTVEDGKLPQAPGSTQITESCMQCHGVDVIVARRRSPDEWSQVVSQMIGYGASLTDDQYKTILTYLSENLASSTAAPAPASPATSRPAAHSAGL